MHGSAGSILDILKYRDTSERSIPILHGIAILRYNEYRTSTTVHVCSGVGIGRFDPYKNCRYRSIAQNLDIAVATIDSSMPNIGLAYWYRR